jgi:uncharacterized RmlC-like cupin family protein
MSYLPDGTVLSNSAPINDGRSRYTRWVEEQGIPVFEGFHVPDLNTLPLGYWERKGAEASFVHLTGAAQINSSYVCEIPAGGTTQPDRHLFEEIVYIVSGRGATTVSNFGGNETSFEWQAGSLFAIPLNTQYQHFNGSGSEPARYYAVTSAPLMLNLLHNDDLIFGLDFDFTDRFGAASDFSGAGSGYAGRVWETNFIADVGSLPLQQWGSRGKGSSNIMLELADSSLCAHVSEFPVGTYKKAHRHGAGAHVVIIAGEGYTLLWPEGEPIQRVDWKPGSVVAPPDQWFHQHFNLSPEPARYLAMRWGSAKNHVFSNPEVDRSVSLGGSQIEYEDELPEIRRTFVEELQTRGIPVGLGARG